MNDQAETLCRQARLRALIVLNHIVEFLSPSKIQAGVVVLWCRIDSHVIKSRIHGAHQTPHHKLQDRMGEQHREGLLQQQLYIKRRLLDSLCMGFSCSDEHGMGGATLQLAVSHTFNMGTDAVNPSTC